MGTGVVPGSDAGGAVGIQAGDNTEHYYYAGWRCIEERNGSGYTTAQTVFGTQYIDEPVCRDRNTDVGSSDSDCLESGGSQRYFYHQDANYRVVALTNESGGVVERYEYDAYGEPRVYGGVGSGSVELGGLLAVSSVGNPYMHQGLRRDDETGMHENRMRVLHSRLGRFIQRDPLGFRDSMNWFEYIHSSSWDYLDPLGLQTKNPTTQPVQDGTGGNPPQSPQAEEGNAVENDVDQFNASRPNQVKNGLNELANAGHLVAGTLLKFNPITGMWEAVSGKDGVSGEALGPGERIIAITGVLPGGGAARAAQIAHRLNLVKKALRIPAGLKPITKGFFKGKKGTDKWWLYKVCKKDGTCEWNIVIEHSDGSVHASVPKKSWFDPDKDNPLTCDLSKRGSPKYHGDGETIHPGDDVPGGPKPKPKDVEK
jgi:RHS repeat-associated protein